MKRESRRPASDSLADLIRVFLSYHSRRLSDFASWDTYEDDIRMEILKMVRRPFCSAGYLKVLLNAKGPLPEMDGFCDDVNFQNYVTIKDVVAVPVIPAAAA